MAEFEQLLNWNQVQVKSHSANLFWIVHFVNVQVKFELKIYAWSPRMDKVQVTTAQNQVIIQSMDASPNSVPSDDLEDLGYQNTLVKREKVIPQ